MKVITKDKNSSYPAWDEGNPSWVIVKRKINKSVHNLKIKREWHNCGEVTSSYECSCGFYTSRTSGNGCWQWGHNISQEPEFDKIHQEMVDFYAKS